MVLEQLRTTTLKVIINAPLYIFSVTSMAETTGDDKDTRTDEEKRLDEFVKSLRLTKTGKCFIFNK